MILLKNIQEDDAELQHWMVLCINNIMSVCFDDLLIISFNTPYKCEKLNINTVYANVLR
jgi:hypothetical protein